MALARLASGLKTLMSSPDCSGPCFCSITQDATAYTLLMICNAAPQNDVELIYDQNKPVTIIPDTVNIEGIQFCLLNHGKQKQGIIHRMLQ